MASTMIASFGEPEEYVATLRENFDINLVTTGAGAFHARLTRITLGHLTIMSGEELLPRIGFIAVPSGRILFALPVARQSSPVWNGIEMAPDRIVSLGASWGAHARTAPGCNWATIVAMEASLLSDMRALTGSAHLPPSDLCVWQPEREPLEATLALHGAAIKLVRRYPDLCQVREAAHGLQEQLAESLIQCISARPPEPRPGMPACAELMARFERLTSTKGDRPRTIADICRELNVTERGLRDCCTQQLGMGPYEYIRLQWLSGRRRDRRVTR